MREEVISMTEDIRPHYRLEAWQEAVALVKSVYEVSRHFPAEELYGLTAQVQRSAISRGSLSELETQLLIAVELG
jgi:hypothetical protein